VKFLIACALIAAMSQTAMAQTTIPEKCQNLHVTDYPSQLDNVGNLILYAVIKNDDPFDSLYATFYFDLLICENFTIGQGPASIQRLLQGDSERERIFYSADRKIQTSALLLGL
jgi:hypothetical protein